MRRDVSRNSHSDVEVQVPGSRRFRQNRAMRKTDQSSGEFQRVPERIYCDDERWYVRTREGMRGPFGSRRAAAAEAALFVDTMAYLERLRTPDHVDRDGATIVKTDKLPWR